MAVDLDWVASRCTSALLLEVSATPKPGLVDRLKDFRETKFQHFLVSASTLYKWFRIAAKTGLHKKGKGLGRVIYRGVLDMLSDQKGGNTHLGAFLLLIPIASASTLSQNTPIKISSLKKHLPEILSNMDWRDSVMILKAIKTVSPRSLGRIAFMDVFNQETYREIEEKKLKPIEVFRKFVDREVVAHEWVKNYSRSFYGASRLMENLREMDLEEALTQTFLQLLSRYTDTHIQRRGGKALATRISYMASKILENGGVKNSRGRELLVELDKLLRNNWRTRPGATADLLASSITITLLNGWIP
ncbi:MAG: triphosphoribosyl-dephospho-CoA synthase [Nitrososphaerota archaeon]